MCCNCSLWEPGDKDKDAVLEKDLLCKIYVCICVCNGVKNHGDDRGGGVISYGKSAESTLLFHSVFDRAGQSFLESKYKILVKISCKLL